jgi:threonine dehydratase
LATQTAPTLDDIRAARGVIEGLARVTPVYSSDTFSRLVGREVHLKAENLQRTGSFKIRGAVNKVASLSAAERAAGVVTASAGNHGQAVAWAAREAGSAATIFVPQDAPMAKVEAIHGYGADVKLAGDGYDAAVEHGLAFAAETGATYVHAFEDPLVVAGQGTLGLELAEQVPNVGTLLVPVGGGGLAAGMALALRGVRPDVRLVGVRAAAAHTIADGIAVKHPGELTMSILDRELDDLVEVTDEQISGAILLLAERTKLVVEGAGAVGIAALLHGLAGGEGPAAVVLSGGNIDPSLLIQVMRYGLTQSGRYLVLATRIPDRPGELLKLLELVADERANIVAIEHRREGMTVSVAETEVELTLATRNEEHCAALLEAMRARGYAVERLE